MLLACIGVGVWLALPKHTYRATSASQNSPLPSAQHTPTTSTSLVAQGTLTPASSAPATSTATASPSASSATPTTATTAPGGVVIATPAAANTLAPGVATFLGEYFTAINHHDYQAYVALLSPQAQGITQAQFDSGYGSTADSREKLQGISTAGNGDLVANVTFTSHQNPSDSPSQTACTSWNISLYLIAGNANNYMIDNPPSSYHAKYAACG